MINRLKWKWSQKLFILDGRNYKIIEIGMRHENASRLSCVQSSKMRMVSKTLHLRWFK